MCGICLEKKEKSDQEDRVCFWEEKKAVEEIETRGSGRTGDFLGKSQIILGQSVNQGNQGRCAQFTDGQAKAKQGRVVRKIGKNAFSSRS